MTNDEIKDWAANIAFEAVDKPHFAKRFIEEALREAVTAALEEAAKVALDHDCKRDYCSAACVFGVGKAIRALIPSTGTKE